MQGRWVGKENVDFVDCFPQDSVVVLDFVMELVLGFVVEQVVDFAVELVLGFVVEQVVDFAVELVLGFVVEQVVGF